MVNSKKVPPIKKVKAFQRLINRSDNKLAIIANVLLLLLTLLSSIYLVSNLLKLDGIEDALRYIFIFIIAVTNLIFIFQTINLIFVENKLKTILFTLFLLTITLGQFIFAGNIERLYSSLSNFSKESITYGSSLIVLSDSELSDASSITGLHLGMIGMEENKEGFILPTNYLTSNGLTDINEVTKYDNFLALLDALYKKEVDAIFVSSNYVVMFTASEGYEKIGEETKEIRTFEEELLVEDQSSDKKVTEPFTILLMGVDSKYDGLDKSAAFNGDGLMLITFNPITLNATIMSIPRDTFVPIACFKNQIENKITHAAWQGESCMIDTIENFTGIQIDYFVKVNFKGVVSLVDALGGIEVDVPISFCEQNSDRDWGNKTICLETGIQILNGEEALALSRHRKTISDIVRGLNQQLVINGIINKIKDVNTVDKFYTILDTISNNMDTNMKADQMLDFYNVAMSIVQKSGTEGDLITFQQLFLSGYSAMIYDERFGKALYDYVLHDDSLAADVEAMKINLGLIKPTIIKKLTFNVNEPFEATIIGKGDYRNDTYIITVPNFIYKTEDYITEWASKKNIALEYIFIDQDSETFKPSYNDGDFISQSIPRGYRVNNIKSDEILYITYVKLKEEPIIPEKVDCNLEENESSTECILPDFIGQSKQSVITWDNTTLIRVTIDYIIIPKTDSEWTEETAGDVISQSSEGGTSAYLLSEGTLTIEHYEEIEVVIPDDEETPEDDDTTPGDEEETTPPDEDESSEEDEEPEVDGPTE